jgi:hypothetical protein
MPFDITENTNIVPERLDFEVEFEPTKFEGKKYVINAKTGEYVGIVGKGFNCVSHTSFFNKVLDTVIEELPEDLTQSRQLRFSSARNNAWAMLDITLPDISTEIHTDKHTTTVKNRIIALHGIDGSCSNQAFFGAIDFFCTNGCISGDHEKIRRKNTSAFSLDEFIRELSTSRADFYNFTVDLQKWADTDLTNVRVDDFLQSLIGSERKANKMYELYNAETAVRGQNKWALYSAFTNYSTYADERNGFTLRDTGNDTKATSMFSREQEVSKWISSGKFRYLEAA